jgi:hypothetical protein
MHVMELSPERRCRCPQHHGGQKWHGSVSGYTYHKCRCEECRDGWAKHNRSYYHDRIPEKTCTRKDCGKAFRGVGHKYCSSECRNAEKSIREREQYAANPTKYESRLVRRRRALWVAQDGRCALCHEAVAFDEAALDHDHACCPIKTARACGECDRAVLHRACNSMLGFAADDPKLLAFGIAYLGGL